MADIQVHPIRDRRDKRIFLTFPWRIYKDDPLWVPPLLPDREKVINPEHGVFFQRGEADFFIAWRDGEPVGTICAAEDPPTNAFRGKKECLFGFFEYINDEQVFQALVETAAAWGRERGLQNLYGPWNLDYEDGYGVLVEGRDRPPVMMCGHTPEYYRERMDAYGFQPARDHNIALAIDLMNNSHFERMRRVAKRVLKRGRVTIRGADFDHWEREVDILHNLLTRALAHLDDHIGWRRDALQEMLEPFKQIADPEMILFADVDGETVGFLPGVPNMNEILMHVNGLRYPWDYVKLLWYLKMVRPTCMAVKSGLVLPEYWSTGVVICLAAELLERALEKDYTWADLSITSADNPNSVPLALNLGAEIYKRWQVYRLDI
jgi:hypothetical protein